ncbi:NACHT domain-containing protein [Streptomyces sp. BF23-18]|uniref:NACHT domain-containing protein n=1 Tax=Streptomyces sp. BF23-18 TaxID=3240282 RepID=UPI0034E5819B
MVTAGGAGDKLPNRFEHWWTALQVARLLRGEASSIHLEPLNAAGEGIEFEIRFPDGPCCDQVKASGKAWTPGAIAEVLRKVKAHLAEGKRVRLIVATDAPKLRGLCVRARDADVFEDFEESRTGPHADLFAKVVEAWVDVDHETAWRYLRLVEVLHEPEEGLQRAVNLSYAALVQGDSEAVVSILRALFDQQIHHVLTAPLVWDYLEKREVRRRFLVGDTTTVDALRGTVERFVFSTKPQPASFGLAARPHADDLIELLTATGPAGRQIVLCEGAAGMGKSTVVSEVAQRLQGRGWYTAAVRMSAVSADTQSAACLGRSGAMGLQDSPAVVLASVAGGQLALLVVDQLDAVSTYSGRMAEVFVAVDEMLGQLLYEPKVRVLLVARTVDVEHDFRLRELASQTERVRRFKLGELSDDAVREVLLRSGSDPANLSSQTLRLLRVPLHLSVFSRLTAAARTGSYRTLQQLYDQFTEERRTALEPKTAPAAWSRITGALVEYLSDNETLSAPDPILDAFDRTDLRVLESEGILVKEAGARTGFFHESYFDYLFARTFMAGTTRLHDFLVDSGQALFRRAQTRQILEHAEAIDPNRFRSDVRELLESQAIRPHINDVVITVLRQIDATSDDWKVVADLAWSPSPLAPKIRSLLARPAWFDAADHDGYWEDLLADPATAEEAFNFLVSLVAQRSQRVSDLVQPYVGVSDAWRERLQRLIFWAMSADLEPLVVELIDRGELDDPHGRETGGTALLSNLDSLAAQDSRSATRILGAYLRRAAARASQDGQPDPFTAGLLTDYTPAARDVITPCADGAPATFVDEVLPFVLEIAATKEASREAGGKTSWAHPYLGSHDVGSLLIRGLDQALRALAASQPDTVRNALQQLMAINGPETNYIVARVHTVFDQPDEAVAWLLADNRLRQGTWDDVLWATRDMIKSVTPRCSNDSLNSLLTSLLAHYPCWERPRPDRRGLWGITQYRLLSAVDPTCHSDLVRRRLGEWDRKFGKDAPGILTASPSTAVSDVVSAIGDTAAARMKDKQWLKALAVYAKPENNGPWSSRGGALALSQTLGRQAEREPQRFARLVLALNRTAPLVYFTAVLHAVAPSLDANVFADLCAHTYQCVGPSSIPEICRAIESNPTRTNQGLVGLLDTFSEDQTTSDGYTATDDLVTAGINTNRGQVAYAAGTLLSQGEQHLSALTPIVKRLANDPSPAVRACAARAVFALRKHSPDTAMDLADELMASTAADIYGAYTVRDMLILALRQDIARFSHHLLQALSLPADAGNSGGQAWACLALWGVLTPDLPATVQELSEPARNGAAQVFAQHPELSLPWLADLLNDTEPTIRDSAAKATFNLKQLKAAALSDFVQTFTRSKAFPKNQRTLLSTLNQQTSLPLAAIEACEQAAAQGTDARLTGRYSIPLLLRLDRQGSPTDRDRCLDVIDRLALTTDLAPVDEVQR